MERFRKLEVLAHVGEIGDWRLKIGGIAFDAAHHLGRAETGIASPTAVQ